LIVFAHTNYMTPLSAHENHIFLPFWAQFGSYMAYFKPIVEESLTLGQTTQLRQKIRLIDSNCI